MKLPQSLIKYGGSQAKLGTDAEDTDLTKMGTLRRWIARAILMIPMPGAGIAVRPTPDGDVWTLGVQPSPFQISSRGKVHPALVGNLMPTLDGEPLDTTSLAINLTDHDGTFIVWFQIDFTPTYYKDRLTNYSLDSVSVETGTDLPADTDSTKHLQFNSITNGQPAASFFSSSIPVQLKDGGANATILIYSNA